MKKSHWIVVSIVAVVILVVILIVTIVNRNKQPLERPEDNNSKKDKPD